LDRIPVNAPLIAPGAEEQVLECIRSGWVSSNGPHVERFERAFADWLGAPHAIACTNGTSALHLALASLGIGPGDEVIVPSLTIISCALAVLYTGARPVFVDVERTTGNIDVALVERAITRKTRAIMPVHLWGQPVDMAPLHTLASKHRLLIVEDAAEAHGAAYHGRKVGTLGDAGCFSFYANKIITTGEGGMVVTARERVARQARLLRDLAHSPKRRFWHLETGFNYRMTSLQAALGLAQLQEVDAYLAKKRWMAAEYTRRLSTLPGLRLPVELPGRTHVHWMYAVIVEKRFGKTRNALMQSLQHHGIDTRTFFAPLHRQPVLRQLGLGRGQSLPVSEDLSRRGLYLPSGLAITEKQIDRVCEIVGRAARGAD
jgi:perosamine synthetase